LSTTTPAEATHGSEIAHRKNPRPHQPDRVIGRFSLQRTPEAGGEASGRYTLIWNKTPAGWKIVYDHTS
jgi:hypothetical protein